MSVYLSRFFKCSFRGRVKDYKIILNRSDCTGCLDIEIKPLGFVIHTSIDELGHLWTIILDAAIKEEKGKC